MSWRQFVFSVDGFDQAALLVAASGAKCTSVLALGALTQDLAASSLQYLCHHEIEGGFAVSVSTTGDEAIRLLLSSAIGSGLKSVVLTDPTCRSLPDSIAWCRSHGLEPLSRKSSVNL